MNIREIINILLEIYNVSYKTNLKYTIGGFCWALGTYIYDNRIEYKGKHPIYKLDDFAKPILKAYNITSGSYWFEKGDINKRYYFLRMMDIILFIKENHLEEMYLKCLKKLIFKSLKNFVLQEESGLCAMLWGRDILSDDCIYRLTKRKVLTLLFPIFNLEYGKENMEGYWIDPNREFTRLKIAIQAYKMYKKIFKEIQIDG